MKPEKDESNEPNKTDLPKDVLTESEIIAEKLNEVKAQLHKVNSESAGRRVENNKLKNSLEQSVSQYSAVSTALAELGKEFGVETTDPEDIVSTIAETLKNKGDDQETAKELATAVVQLKRITREQDTLKQKYANQEKDFNTLQNEFTQQRIDDLLEKSAFENNVDPRFKKQFIAYAKSELDIEYDQTDNNYYVNSASVGFLDLPNAVKELLSQEDSAIFLTKQTKGGLGSTGPGLGISSHRRGEAVDSKRFRTDTDYAAEVRRTRGH